MVEYNYHDWPLPINWLTSNRGHPWMMFSCPYLSFFLASQFGSLYLLKTRSLWKERTKDQTNVHKLFVAILVKDQMGWRLKLIDKMKEQGLERIFNTNYLYCFMLSSPPIFLFSLPWAIEKWNMQIQCYLTLKRRVTVRTYIMTRKETVLKALFSHSRMSSFLIQILCQERHVFPCAWLLSQSMCHLKMKGHLYIYSRPTLRLISIVRVTFFWCQVKNKNSTLKNEHFLSWQLNQDEF